MDYSEKIISPNFDQYSDDENYPLKYLHKDQVEQLKKILVSMVHTTQELQIERNAKKNEENNESA